MSTKKLDYYAIHRAIVAKYGEPYSLGKKGQIIKLNEQYFATFFMAVFLSMYYVPENCFYLYSIETGGWEKVTKNKMFELVGRFIHEYALFFKDPEISDKRSKNTVLTILEYLKGQAENKDAFDVTRQNIFYIHCSNAMLVFDAVRQTWKTEEFSPEYFSRNVSPLVYSKGAKCPRFLEKLLGIAMTEDDIKLLQLYVGQCLLKRNLSQTGLLCTGMPGGGKSTLANIIEGIVGHFNCTELRLEHVGGRFEIGRIRGMTLLTAKDVSSAFLSLNGSKKLKALTGGDRITTEYKNSNNFTEIEGIYNVIVTSNAILRIEFDDDVDAWRRRLLWIKFERPPTTEKIIDFDKILLKEEGSGILNWGLAGAAKLLRSGGKINKTPEQEARVDMLISYSRPFEVFAKQFIQSKPGITITTSEAVAAFMKFCKKIDCPLLPERKVQRVFHQWMRSEYGAVLRTDIQRNGKNKRGYSGYQLRK